MAQNEQTTEEHSTLEQQSPRRLDHPAWCVVCRGVVVRERGGAAVTGKARSPSVILDNARVIDAAHIVCNGRVSVCLSHRSTAAKAAGGFAAECPVGRRYQSTKLRAPALSSKREQCHVESQTQSCNVSTYACILSFFWGAPRCINVPLLPAPPGIMFTYYVR